MLLKVSAGWHPFTNSPVTKVLHGCTPDIQYVWCLEYIGEVEKCATGKLSFLFDIIIAMHRQQKLLANIANIANIGRPSVLPGTPCLHFDAHLFVDVYHISSCVLTRQKPESLTPSSLGRRTLPTHSTIIIRN